MDTFAIRTLLTIFKHYYNIQIPKDSAPGEANNLTKLFS